MYTAQCLYYLWQAFSFLLHEVVLLKFVIGVVLMPGLQKFKPTVHREKKTYKDERRALRKMSWGMIKRLCHI